LDNTKPLIIIKPKKGWQIIDFRELRQFRDLLFFLVIRDIKVKYKQTVLGGLWAIIQPLFSMIIFTIFFGRLAKIPSDGVPYPVFNFTAMVIWTYFSGAINSAGNSLIGDSRLISKVYFPRLFIPLAPVLAGLLDFVIAFILLVGMILYYRIIPTGMILFAPVLVFLMALSACGMGMFLAALNAKYRDIRYAIPFLIQLWLFASPIVYPASLVPEKYRLIYALNPICGIIEGFRSSLLGTTSFPWVMVAISMLMSIAMFLIGLQYFKQTERYFADII
jgi:lipopolysaccharide transport system permease protein